MSWDFVFIGLGIWMPSLSTLIIPTTNQLCKYTFLVEQTWFNNPNLILMIDKFNWHEINENGLMKNLSLEASGHNSTYLENLQSPICYLGWLCQVEHAFFFATWIFPKHSMNSIQWLLSIHTCLFKIVAFLQEILKHLDCWHMVVKS